MTGLALGAQLSSIAFVRRNPLRTWAIATLVCAAFGGILPWFLSGDRLQLIARMIPDGASDALSATLRYLVSFAVLLIPTTAMGAGYPLLVQHLKGADKSPPNVAGELYASNVTGAMIGSIGGSFLLLPSLGIRGASITAIVIDLFLLCSIGFLLQKVQSVPTSSSTVAQKNATSFTADSPLPPSKGEPPSNAQPPDFSVDNDETVVSEKHSPERLASGTSAPIGDFLTVAFAGAAVMIQELVWTRLFASVFGSSVYSTGTVFCLVLAGMASGAWLISRSRKPNLHTILCLTAAAGLITSYGATFLPQMLLHTSNLVAPLPLSAPLSFTLTRVLVAIPVIIPASLLSGMIFPAVTIRNQAPQAVRKLYVASCIGSGAGALLGGALALPALTTQFAQGLTICATLASLLFAVMSLTQSNCESRKKFFLPVSAISVCLLSLWIAPGLSARSLAAGICFYDSRTLQQFGNRLLATDVVQFHEGLNATIAITRSRNTLALRSNGKVEATLPIDSTLIAPGCDLSTHALLGLLPLILHPAPNDALLIGYGSGITCDALSSIGLLKSLTVAELEQAVLSARTALQPSALQYFPNTSRPPVEFKVNDGRFVLAASKKQWDIIVCQAAEPRTAGAADLYTREFWQLVRSKLRANGICAQWLQLYSMPEQQMLQVLRTFQSVFPETRVFHGTGAGEVILIGSPIQLHILEEQLKERINHSNENSYALAYCGVTTPADLVALCKVNPDELNRLTQDSSILLDDTSVLEYACGTLLAPPEELIEHNYQTLTSLNDTGLLTLVRASHDQNRLLSDASVTLARFAATGALGSRQDASLAGRFAKISAEALPCAQTWLNSFLVKRATEPNEQRNIGRSENGERRGAGRSERSKPGTPYDALARAQAEFLHVSDSQPLSKQREAEIAESLSNCGLAQLAETSLIRGWTQLSRSSNTALESSDTALEHFTASLSARPRWAPALLGLSLCASSSTQPISVCSERLRIDPFDSQAHLLMTRLLIKEKRFDEALNHAVDAAAITGRGEGFIFLLAKTSAPTQILGLYKQFAPRDARINSFQTLISQPAALAKLAAQWESKWAQTGVSGYNKLGFP
jgi:spermidine synthase